DKEFLVAPCGLGVTARYLAESSGASGAGVDPDPELAERATQLTKQAGLSERLHFEPAALDDLPYQDAVFDVVVGELPLSSAPDPAAALRELARVTGPMGTVVLIQLVWTGHVDPGRREMIVDHLGTRPYLLVEWKQMLRDAGIVDLYVEDWSDSASVLRQALVLRGLADLFPLRERLAILYRGVRRWGWRGVWEAITRDRVVQRLVTRDRILGMSLITGKKWQERPGPEP